MSHYVLPFDPHDPDAPLDKPTKEFSKHELILLPPPEITEEQIKAAEAIEKRWTSQQGP